MDKETLSKRIVEYFKKTREEDFEEYFISENEAYDNFVDLLSKKPIGVCMEISEEISSMLKYEDLTNPEMKAIYDECSAIALDLNYYKANFEKEKSTIDL